ncbi:unnamed protein product [Rangifer tarandus platyrhynchus]|uniref:Uncharacterized protein n=1 Tax=Rangifer tarandus platyrhynchus TaxID=3082113 RepID=A0AC59ZWV6_RANTA
MIFRNTDSATTPAKPSSAQDPPLAQGPSGFSRQLHDMALPKMIKEHRRRMDEQREKLNVLGNSLVVQWLRFDTITAGALGSIPSQGTKIQQAVQSSPTPSKNIRSFKQNVHTNTKLNIFNLIVQDLEKYSSAVQQMAYRSWH